MWRYSDVSNAFPRTTRPVFNSTRTGRAAALLFQLALILFVSACASNRDVTDSSPEAADTTAPVAETVPDTTTQESEGPTIGEQLGRLDAMMQTAPADSLPILQAEYQRLLDLATRGIGNVETGAGTLPPEENQEMEIGTIPIGADSVYVGPDGLLGFRKSELAADGGSAPAGSRTTASRTRSAQPRATIDPNVQSSQVTAERARQRAYVDGLTSVRTGQYEQAVKELPAVVASPPAGKRTAAQHSYGEALEKTGNTTKAAEQYRAAASGNDPLAHKSYLSYCRLLAKSGQRDKARKLLVDFIGKHPKSPQTINARQLLQTL